MTAVVVNVMLVVTGGAVRLTGSGLGCPSWPSCATVTLTHHDKLHKFIELNNRRLTGVVAVIVLAVLVVAVLDKREVRLAVLLAASIPAQAVLGGITVLTKLNPWTVSAHFLLSIAIIAIAFTLWWRVAEHPPEAAPAAPEPLRFASWAIAALTLAVLAIGTVVTGSGPHAGAADAGGRVHRTGLNVASMSQLHADAVMLLIGLTVGFALLVRHSGGSGLLQRAVWLLLAVELAQGLIGFVQYFSGVPAVLVAAHLLGASLVWLAALNVVATSTGDPAREDQRSLRR
jgi:cytochrome c oxidase assembly protein subunit 15